MNTRRVGWVVHDWRRKLNHTALVSVGSCEKGDSIFSIGVTIEKTGVDSYGKTLAYEHVGNICVYKQLLIEYTCLPIHWYLSPRPGCHRVGK